MNNITKDDIKTLIDSGLYNSTRELALAIGINEVTVHEWITDKKKLTNIHKKLWYYFIQWHEQKEQIKRLEKQLKSDNQTDYQKQINELSTKLDTLTKQFENFKTSLNKKEE